MIFPFSAEKVKPYIYIYTPIYRALLAPRQPFHLFDSRTATDFNALKTSNRRYQTLPVLCSRTAHSTSVYLQMALCNSLHKG